MQTITTTEAKARLNAVLSQVAAGETFTVTSHGRPIAVISRPGVPTRSLGQLAGRIVIPDDFDAPMSAAELAEWGEAS